MTTMTMVIGKSNEVNTTLSQLCDFVMQSWAGSRHTRNQHYSRSHQLTGQFLHWYTKLYLLFSNRAHVCEQLSPRCYPTKLLPDNDSNMQPRGHKQDTLTTTPPRHTW